MQNGWTALMRAADKGNIDIVKMLIDRGAAATLRSKVMHVAISLCLL